MACVPMKATISRKTMDWWEECEKGDIRRKWVDCNARNEKWLSVMITLFLCDERGKEWCWGNLNASSWVDIYKIEMNEGKGW